MSFQTTNLQSVSGWLGRLILLDLTVFDAVRSDPSAHPGATEQNRDLRRLSLLLCGHGRARQHRGDKHRRRPRPGAILLLPGPAVSWACLPAGRLPALSSEDIGR